MRRLGTVNSPDYQEILTYLFPLAIPARIHCTGWIKTCEMITDIQRRSIPVSFSAIQAYSCVSGPQNVGSVVDKQGQPRNP